LSLPLHKGFPGTKEDTVFIEIVINHRDHIYLLRQNGCMTSAMHALDKLISER